MSADRLMLEAKDLSLTYSSVDSFGTEELGAESSDTALKIKALDALNLELAEGACHVVTGPSGSGKSSLLRLALKLIPELYPARVEGELKLCAKAIEDYSHLDLCYLAAYVQQDTRAQFFTCNVQDELFFGLENLAYPKAEMLLRVRAVCTLLGLENLLDKSILALSSGERQKVALACALVSRPRLLILDEPSANLDQSSIAQLQREIKRLKDLGFTILIAEHRLYYLKDILDNLLILKDGKLAKRLGRAELNPETIKEYQLRSLEEEIFILPSRKDVAEAAPLNKAEHNCLFKGENIILNDWLPPIDLELKSGVVTALVGRNGIGKTTLARYICGVNTSSKRKRKASPFYNLQKEQGVFFVMQDCDYQLFAPTIREELLLSKAASREAQVELLNSLGLNFSLNDLERLPAELSGGQKQRLVIALAILSEAKLVILDEPSSGLDYPNMRRVARLSRELAAQGRAVLVITHDRELISYAADEIAFMTERGISKAVTLVASELDSIRERWAEIY
ncbi:MAG: ABC transporter ATP-binding protein [Eubacteriales bacterium]|nr:ABC transporter ATP-binding protein [Eubacteriales bacterium]